MIAICGIKTTMPFPGVELTSPPDAETKLVRQDLVFPKYAYTKHIGSYTQLFQVHT
ncbi:MAG: hypothetical protein AAF512_24690 [Pseudomonadota bacterium]